MEGKTLSVPRRRDLSLGVSGLEMDYDLPVITIEIFTLNRLHGIQLAWCSLHTNT